MGRSGRRRGIRRSAVALLAVCLTAPLSHVAIAQAPSPPAAASPQVPVTPSAAASPQVPVTPPAAASPIRIPDDASLVTAAAVALDETPPSPDELPTFEAVRDQARAILDSMSEPDWDIAALASSLEYDPDRAFAFVRDSIGIDPYPGVLRGAAGTLDARSGSPADRALLLGALLDAMEVEYRFAFQDLDDAAAQAIVDRAALPPSSPLPRPGLEATPVFPAEAIESRASRDYAQLRLALGSDTAATDDASRAQAIDAVREHVWVQRRFGTTWLDLDTTMPTAQPGKVLSPTTGAPTASTATASTATTGVPTANAPTTGGAGAQPTGASTITTVDTLPATLDHTVHVRLEEERLEGGSLTTRPLLEYEAPAWDAADGELFLLFAPLTDRLGGTIREQLTGDVEWYPIMMVDGEMQRGQPFKVASSETDLFGASQDPGPPLVGMRLVVETTSPGEPPRRIERMLLDRVPAPLRTSGDARSNGDAQATGEIQEGGDIQASALEPMPEDDGIPRFVAAIRHLMVSTGGADVRDYAQQRYLATDYAGSTLIDATLGDPPTAYGALWPMATADQALVVASENAVVPSLTDGTGARGFVGRPRVVITSVGRDPYRSGSLEFSTDLALDGVSILPGDDPTSGARLQLWYGALQTALESRLALQRAALIDPATRDLEGASLGASGDLGIIDAADPPEGASPALLADLASGSVVLRWSGDPTTHAWWVVDPTDGATRSMIDPGLGGTRPSGGPVAGVRTLDSSYTHGAGPRLPPRPPMQPQAPGGYGPRGGCTGGSEETSLLCNVSLPGAIALATTVGPVVLVTLEVAVFVLLAWIVASG